MSVHLLALLLDGPYGGEKKMAPTGERKKEMLQHSTIPCMQRICVPASWTPFESQSTCLEVLIEALVSFVFKDGTYWHP